jgi:anaerobic selenocysteine-containing dehydrogenase
LARRLGVRDAIFGMTTEDLVRTAFVGATGPVAGIDPDALRATGPMKIDPYPDGQRFKTPSGKLEFYSETLAAQGLSPLPDWHEDDEETALGRRWPLRLLTAPGYFQSHTAFTGNRALRRREGAPVVVLHPADAERRGLRSDEGVELYNERGSVGMRLRISDEVAPGVALVPGQRPAGEALSGTINLLCGDRLSDLGEGATYQSTFLDVRRPR